MTLQEDIEQILRDGAFGDYTTDPGGNFVPLDWSKTPSSYFSQSISDILAAFRKHLPEKPERKGHMVDGNDGTSTSFSNDYEFGFDRCLADIEQILGANK